jgi:putative transposase
MHVHVVFETTYRHHLFADRYLTRPEESMQAVCVDVECELLEFTGEANHVHLRVNLPPKIALSKLSTASGASPPAGCGRSSPTWRQHYWRTQRLWSGSDLAGPIGGRAVDIALHRAADPSRPGHAHPLRGAPRALSPPL